MKKFGNYIATMWRPAGAVLCGLIALTSLLMFSLGTLVPGYASQEVAARASSTSLGVIFNDPSNAPHKLVQYAVGYLKPESEVLMRLVSGAVASFTTVMFYLLVKRWFTQYVALLSTLLFFTSSWFLGSARLATPTIMLTTLISLVYFGHFLRSTTKSWPWILAAIILGVALYGPGIIWFVVAAAAWQIGRLRKSFERLKSSTIIICSTLVVLLVVPLILAAIKNSEFLFTILGIPRDFRPLLDIARHIIHIPITIFYRSPPEPVYWLDDLPLLDFISIALFVLGSLSMARHWKLDRSRLTAGVLFLGTVWVGLSGERENIIILLPFIYIVIAAGIHWLLREWLLTFPRNPIAKAIGSSLVAVAILFSCNYHITRYFLAWPSAPATTTAFSEKL